MVEFLPEENADGWADAWQMVKDTPNADCALKWLDYVISPEGQCGVVGVTGYSGSNPVALKACLSSDLWQEPARVDKYIEIWNAVKAAQ